MATARRASGGGDGGQRKAAPTMRDIAAAANVSQSTVSRVLNNAPTRVPIAEETRERVTLAARKLGYRPNPLARGLRGAPTMLLGAVVRDITDPFFAGAIEALSIEAMARGYNVVLGHAQGRTDQALALTAVLETRHCDAIVLLGDMQDQPRLLADLRTSLVPVVALWQGSSLLEVPTVDVDNVAGVRAGLEHLVGLGHRRIAFVSGRHLGDIREREAAFIDFMTERFGGVRTGLRPPGPEHAVGRRERARRPARPARAADGDHDLDRHARLRRAPRRATASAAPSPTPCRWWASTTSCSRATPSRR